MNLNDLFQEIAEYLNFDVNKIHEKYIEISKKYDSYKKWSHITEEEFNNLVKEISDPNQLTEFYANMDNYIF